MPTTHSWCTACRESLGALPWFAHTSWSTKACHSTKPCLRQGFFRRLFFFVELLQVKRGVYIDIASSLRFPTCFFYFFWLGLFYFGVEKKAEIPKFLYEKGGNLPRCLVALGGEFGRLGRA